MQKPRTWEEFRQLAYEREKALPRCEWCGKPVYPQDQQETRTSTFTDKTGTETTVSIYHNGHEEFNCFEKARQERDRRKQS